MVKDHRGDTFVSEMEMCNSWGVDYRLFKERRRHGWNLRLALTTPFYEGTNIFDHKGNDRKVFRVRMNSGWTLKDALTMIAETPIVEKDTLTS